MDGVPPIVWDLHAIDAIESEAAAMARMGADDFAYNKGLLAGQRMERERLRANFKVGWDAMEPNERARLKVYGIDRLVAKVLEDPTP